MFIHEETAILAPGVITRPIVYCETAPIEIADQRKQRKVDKILYRLGRSAVGLATRAMFSLDVSYHAALPEGPKIVVANHPTTLDPIVMISLLPERLSILVTGGAFRVPLFGRYLRETGHVPVVRGSGQNALDRAGELLNEGRSIGIFPEGSLSPMHGGFQQPRTGAARLALASGVPVIPMGINLERKRLKYLGTYVDEAPALGHFYLSGPYAVTVGEPMQFEGEVEDRSLVRNISSEIMSSIIQLSEESARRIPDFPIGGITGENWTGTHRGQYA